MALVWTLPLQRVTQLRHILQRCVMPPKMSETTTVFHVQHCSVHEWLMSEDPKAVPPSCMGWMTPFETGSRQREDQSLPPLTTNLALLPGPSPTCLCLKGLLLEGKQFAEEPVGVSEETAGQLPW